jgi:plastocyanin domain-containing protein
MSRLTIVALLALSLQTLADAAPKERRIELSVTERGFTPSPVEVKKGEPLLLVITRKTDRTCAKEIVVPALNMKAALPLDQPVEVRLTPKKSGELKYGCAMGQMISGVLTVR